MLRPEEAIDYLDQPKEVSLETFSRCNAACTFCPYPTLDRIGTKMPDELIDRLIDEMSEWRVPFDFCPFKVSEPLLDKRLMRILGRIDTETIARTRLFTNGQALTWAWLEKLNTLDRLHVWVSLNEVDAQAYQALMGVPFDRVAKNLDVLHDSDFVHPVTVSRVGADADFARYVRSRWPRFEMVQIKRDGWLGFTDAAVSVVPDAGCSRWLELSVMATGVVSLCCMDGEGRHAIGDLNQQTLLEVYNAPAWRARREQMMSRRAVYPCSTCTY